MGDHLGSNRKETLIKVLSVLGTRPEVVKMAPLIQLFQRDPRFESHVLATAQHRDLLDQTLELFDISVDVDLDLMTPGQTLDQLTARIITESTKVLKSLEPELVVVQGDTTTVFSVALAAFYLGIPVAHVEAGLRTGNIRNPFPEEANRILTTKLASWHFAPTSQALQNLLQEGVERNSILLSGNTVIDSLLAVVAGRKESLSNLPADSKQILITCHRRENFGKPLSQIVAAISHLAESNPQYTFKFPVHPNPNVTTTVFAALGGKSNVELCEPLDYEKFVEAMMTSHIILTDSGGVQEEAPALGVPVLVMRNDTERPEAVDAGVAKLVGSEMEDIIESTQALIDDRDLWEKMAKGSSPYGDGKAAQRIVDFITEQMGPRGGNIED